MAQPKDGRYYQIKSDITAQEEYLRGYQHDAETTKDPTERRVAKQNVDRTRNTIANLKSELKQTYGD